MRGAAAPAFVSPTRRGGIAATLGVALISVLTASTNAAAQRSGVNTSLSAGAVSVRYADEPALSALTVSPLLTYASPRALTAAAATFSLAGEGRWSSQGTLLGSLLSPMTTSRWLGELSGVAGGSTHADGARTAQLLASGRLHHVGSTFSGWIGLGAGSMWDGVFWRPVRQAELGLARRGERTTITATLMPTRAADTLRYTDAQLSMEGRALDRFVLRASLGGRIGAALPVLGRDERIWGDLGLTTWISERMAVVAAAGTYPVDPTQGYPSGRFISIALRVGGRNPVAPPPSADEVLARREASEAGVRDFDVQPLVADAGRVSIRVRATDARRVEIMGDPTTWMPVSLERSDDGWWSLVLAAGAGAHEIVIRVDGGAWIVPPGLPVVVDEFGGRTGRLFIAAP